MDPSTLTAIFIGVAVVVVLAVLISFVSRRRRTGKLRDRFGPEYERTIADSGDRRRAEAELHEREKRVSKFDIRPLSASERDHFVNAWRMIQAEFVDHPKEALAKADDLLTDVMRARGYPMENFDQRSADLSVDHPSVVQNYRVGRELAMLNKQGQGNTEDLRQAMIHFRTLFDELVADSAVEAERRA